MYQKKEEDTLAIPPVEAGDDTVEGISTLDHHFKQFQHNKHQGKRYDNFHAGFYPLLDKIHQIRYNPNFETVFFEICTIDTGFWYTLTGKGVRMQAIFHTNMDELNIHFLEMIKKQFAHAKVEIIIRDEDETDYLNSSSANRKHLEEAIKEVNKNRLISKSKAELEL
jgi:hypothetical protein